MSPWERRERGGLYYTRSRKEGGGRVVREYIGGGVLGEFAAQQDAEKRRIRKEEAATWREERKSMEALDKPVEELCRAAEILSRAVFVAAGYHQHNRGEWRKRRGTEGSESRDR